MTQAHQDKWSSDQGAAGPEGQVAKGLKNYPPQPVEGNAYMQTDLEFPETWEEARNHFEQAEILPQYFGREFCQLFANLKKGEQSRFFSKIAPLEYEWYLKTV